METSNSNSLAKVEGDTASSVATSSTDTTNKSVNRTAKKNATEKEPPDLATAPTDNNSAQPMKKLKVIQNCIVILVIVRSGT